MGCDFYSALRLLTGLALAAFTACRLTVSSAMTIAPVPAATKIHQLIGADEMSLIRCRFFMALTINYLCKSD
jgi:hypothetical protein